MEKGVWEQGEGGLLTRLKAIFIRPRTCDEVVLSGEIHLKGDEIRVPFTGGPLSVVMGKRRKGQRLYLVPEQPILGGGHSASFLILDPAALVNGIYGFLRLEPGDSIILGRDDPRQQQLFNYPGTVSRRHLTVANTGDSLIFKDLTSDAGTYMGPVVNDPLMAAHDQRRRDNLSRLREIYGGPLEILPRQEAMETIRQVNAVMAHEVHRPNNADGCPGGLIKLPNRLVPIVLGDLHSQVDNLLKLLCENAFLQELEAGNACLVLLGDAVHSEIDGEMEGMENSLLITDLIFKLKLRFPQQVFYLRGNHDSFSEEVQKGGVPQGLLWARHVRRVRGEAYKAEMDRFYSALPFAVMSKSFVACHGAPPKVKVSEELLINAHRYPGLINELIWNRLKRPAYPAGYTKGDVQRFRKALGLDPETPFIVAHNPLSRDVSVWMDVGEIKNHHIVFSGLTHRISLFTRVNKIMVPLIYSAEKLLNRPEWQ